MFSGKKSGRWLEGIKRIIKSVANTNYFIKSENVRIYCSPNKYREKLLYYGEFLDWQLIFIMYSSEMTVAKCLTVNRLPYVLTDICMWYYVFWLKKPKDMHLIGENRLV